MPAKKGKKKKAVLQSKAAPVEQMHAAATDTSSIGGLLRKFGSKLSGQREAAAASKVLATTKGKKAKKSVASKSRLSSTGQHALLPKERRLSGDFSVDGDFPTPTTEAVGGAGSTPITPSSRSSKAKSLGSRKKKVKGKRKAAVSKLATAFSSDDERDSSAVFPGGDEADNPMQSRLEAAPPLVDLMGKKVADPRLANPSQAMWSGFEAPSSSPPTMEQLQSQQQLQTAPSSKIGELRAVTPEISHRAATKIQQAWLEYSSRSSDIPLTQAANVAHPTVPGDDDFDDSAGEPSDVDDEEGNEETQSAEDDDLVQWLEATRLTDMREGLRRLGVEELADITDVEDDDLDDLGMTPVQKRRFKRAVESLALDVGSGGVSAEDVSSAAAAAGVPAIRPKEVKLIEQAGAGSYGVVYKARWRGTEVAVKVLHASLTGAALRGAEAEVTKELKMMKRVGNHRNVISLLGLCHMNYPSRLAIVTDFMGRGSLFDVLTGKRGPVPTFPELVRMAASAAAGVGHLHAEDVIHRDLAARNILVSAHNEVRVGDFGFARILADSDVGVTASTIGPVRWMAPESLRDGMYSAMSDVYAFGCFLFELVTGGEQPWGDLSLPVVGQRVLSGETLDAYLPGDCDPVLREIMRACWQALPSARPPIEDVHHRLRERAEELASGLPTRAGGASLRGVSESKLAPAELIQPLAKPAPSSSVSGGSSGGSRGRGPSAPPTSKRHEYEYFDEGLLSKSAAPQARPVDLAADSLQHSYVGFDAANMAAGPPMAQQRMPQASTAAGPTRYAHFSGARAPASSAAPPFTRPMRSRRKK